MSANAQHPEAGASPGESPALIWRTLGALFFAGGTIGTISLLLPHPAQFDEAALWTNIAISFAASVLCLAAPGRVPPVAVHVVLIAGTLAITRAVYYSYEAGFYTFFYVWVGSTRSPSSAGAGASFTWLWSAPPTSGY